MARPMRQKSQDQQAESVVFSVRLSPEELAALLRLKDAHHIKSRNKAVVALIRAGGDLLVACPEQARSWTSIAQSLMRVGGDINRIARAATRGDLTWGETEQAAFQTYREETLRLARTLRGFAEAARGDRRSADAINKALALRDEG